MGFPRKLVGVAVAAVAGATAWARLMELRASQPPAPPPGEPRRYGWRHAELFYSVRGEGPAALLLHDLYTGATSAEMAPLGDGLAAEFSVHAVDLPGFGRSTRPRMRYRGELFVDAIVELVRHAIGRPTILVGSGLSAAFAAEAALRLGGEAAGLVLLAPPEPEDRTPLEPPPWGELAYHALRGPLGRAYHWWHASPAVRRWVLARARVATPAEIAEGAERLSRAARQSGGHWPLWSLWAGDMVMDPRPAIARSTAPALVLWGARSPRNPAAPELYRAIRPDLAQAVLPGTGRWPHVDRPDAAADAILGWSAARRGRAWREAPSGAEDE